jgi:membrane protease YdiL (CAAX protease family)
MPREKDPVRIAVSVCVYAAIFWVGQSVFYWVLSWLGALAGTVLSTVAAALFTNWLVLRVYENCGLSALGLATNRAAARNAAMGLAGGIGAASLVLGPALLTGAAHLVPAADQPAAWTMPFTIAMLAAGSVGEETLFHGYAFQILLRALGPYATVLAVGAVFALLHGSNPHATWFGLANTAGFGILFGYAFLRSRDLWLPIGLHFGWNCTLPLFGVSLSGLKMNVTGHEMVWTAGALWSGGEYGPEASVLTSGVLLLLFVYIAKAPLGRQTAPLVDLPAEKALCEP